MQWHSTWNTLVNGLPKNKTIHTSITCGLISLSYIHVLTVETEGHIASAIRIVASSRI